MAFYYFYYFYINTRMFPVRGPYALYPGVMLVYASGQCKEQRSCGCSQLWHSALPGMVVGWL